MADNIFEMTRSLGQTRYTRFDETHDNENLVDQISETAAIGDAEGSGTEGSEACVKLLSVAEVAERLQVSQSLVYKMIERRQIPSIRVGRCVRVDSRALEETLRSPGWAR
mgnify:CR=1 FL=1